MERSKSRPNTDNFYQIIGDVNAWDSYFSAEEYEEMTDVAERLRAPMDHTIAFHDRGGRLYCGSSTQGDDLLTISRKAEITAQEMARTNPAWAIEALRRNIETQEIAEATDLPYGAQMLVFSPTPDTVLNGAINIGGYNLEKKTAMVRVWTHGEQGLACRYISLDGGNRAALLATAQAAGREIPTHYDSEEILATHYTFLNGETDLAERVIDGYDAEMKRASGRDHSYGRPGLNHKKALDIAVENPARLHEHMAEIRALKWQYSGAELDKKLEEARYNYAAALDQTTRGEVVTSNGAAGGAARAVGANFAGYCPNGASSNAPNSTQAAYESMFGHKKVTGKCPCCNEITTYDPCDPKCTVCGSDSKTNRAAEYLAKKQTAKDKTGQPKREHHETAKTQKQRQLDQKYGAKVIGRIKRFDWHESPFGRVNRAVGYYGETIAINQDAAELHDIKYGLKKAA